MINEHFSVTGNTESILDFLDFVSVTSRARGDDVQGFDTKWDEVLLKVGDTLEYDILESMYRQKLWEYKRMSKIHTIEEHCQKVLGSSNKGSKL